jgi:thioredoxin 1
MPGDNVVTITQDTWKSEVLDSEQPVLVDFWAEWCGPCKMIAPVLDELSDETVGKLKVAKVNVDEQRDLAGQFGIRSIPTLLIVQGGAVKEQVTGAMSKAQLLAKVEPYMA